MNKNFLLYLFLLLANLVTTSVFTQPIIYSGESLNHFGKSVEILKVAENNLTIKDVVNHKGFTKSKDVVPNLGISSSTFWIRFSVLNKSSNENLKLLVSNPLIDTAELYSPSDHEFKSQSAGDRSSYHKRTYDHQYPFFDLLVPRDSTVTFILKIKSTEQTLVPLSIGDYNQLFFPLMSQDMLFSAFAGIIVFMIIFNLFIFSTIRDTSYLFYVAYIFFIGLTQLCLEGYSFRFFWPEYPLFANQVIIMFPSIAAIFATYFFRDFLNTDDYFPVFKKITNVSVLAFSITITLPLIGYENIAYMIFNFYASIWPWIVLYAAYRAAIKGYRPARIIFAGWLLANTGFTIYALKNLAILPYNNFTNYTMVAGITIEAIVFSIALADKINFFKKENLLKQKEIINQLKINEDTIRKSKELELNTEKLRKEVLSFKYESLKNQVNPHFLFNSLNVLSELIDRNQKEAAEFLKELSAIYRYILVNKNEEVVSLETEVEFIRSFTTLLSIRYGENLKVEIDELNDENYLIPPMTLQLLLENCIKHNIVSGEQPLSIRIQTDEFYLSVKNNLQLKKPIQISSRTGIKNIQERYKYLSDLPVVIESDEQCFTAKVPLLKTLKK